MPESEDIIIRSSDSFSRQQLLQVSLESGVRLLRSDHCKKKGMSVVSQRGSAPANITKSYASVEKRNNNNRRILQIAHIEKE